MKSSRNLYQSIFKVCHDETAPPLVLKCPPNKPFCANGKCGKVNENCGTDAGINAEEFSFECTSDGVFPGK